MTDFEVKTKYVGVSQKYLAPLFIYQIVKGKSCSSRKLTQQEIIKELMRSPYNISVDRRTVSSLVKLISEFDPHFFSQRNSGVWYNPYEFNFVIEKDDDRCA